MWLGGQENTLKKITVLVLALMIYKECDAITNVDFNAQIRNYSGVENNNLTDVKTLQKKALGLGHYADFSPIQNPVKFKDNVDSEISGSSYSRGLSHGHTGYGFDYEEPNFGHGFQYPLHDAHHDSHDHHHYDYHNLDHHHPPAHHGYGHHRYYDHGLGHKALLWPIAGLALLGAAAALVTNPVLLQLGVVSGKRRRRHIEQIESVAKNSIRKWSQITSNHPGDANKIAHKMVKKRMLRTSDFEVGKVGKQVLKSGNSDVFRFKTTDDGHKRYSEEDRRFIPIALKFKKP